MSPRGEEANRRLRERSRRRILDAALALFAEKGFRGASMAEIARRAGVSKGLTYNYFESKEAVLNTLLEERWQRIFYLYEEASEIADPRERLAYVVRATLERAAAEPDQYRLYLGLLLQPGVSRAVIEAKKHLVPRFQRSKDMLSGIFAELGVAEPEQEVHLFGALLNGIVATGIISDTALDPERTVRRVLEIYAPPRSKEKTKR